MMSFMQAGGWSMWVVLLFGLITLVASGLFAFRPDERKIAFIRAMSLATSFSVLSGVTSDIAAVMTKVPEHPEWSKSPDLHLIVMTGIGESMAPAVLGFTMLSLVWMIAAVGVRRLAHAVP
jgi:hypothetical protein